MLALPLTGKKRRADTKAHLSEIGFVDVHVPRGIVGKDLVKRVDKAGRFCKATFSQAGKELTGEGTLKVRCASKERAPGVFGCAWSHAQVSGAQNYRPLVPLKKDQQHAGGQTFLPPPSMALFGPVLSIFELPRASGKGSAGGT